MRQNMVKVRMLVDTAYQGPRKEGDELYVPVDFANRWAKNGIAVVVEEEDKEPEKPAYDESNYDALTAKELYEICKEQGLDVEAKKSKAYYIEKLEAEAAAGEEAPENDEEQTEE